MTETHLFFFFKYYCVSAARITAVVIPAFRGAMDNCTHQPIPSLELASPAPAPAPPAAAPQEATGDSESDAPVSAPTVGVALAAGYAEDDAESCSGGGGSSNRVPVVVVDDDDDRGGAADDVAVEGDENEED